MRAYTIGIMQGRLTPRRDKEIQFFPFDNWQQEFEMAEAIGLDEIEVIFDYENYSRNPLWTPSGTAELGQLSDKTQVAVKSVCFDYFMRRPFFKLTGKEKQSCFEENLTIARTVMKNMQQQDIRLLEIPLVDHSSLTSPQEQEEFQGFLTELLKSTDGDVRIALETDLPPLKFAAYLEQIGSPRVGANYDSGNSSGLGYDCREEIRTLKNYIFNIHIKDRVRHGSTVELGTGSADFPALFAVLKEIGYQGSFILQAARGEDNQEAETIRRQQQFVAAHLLRDS